MFLRQRAGRPEDVVERLLEGVLHDSLVAVDDDRLLELRQRRAGGLDVQRPDVQQRPVDGHDEHVAELDLRPVLAEQRELLRDDRVLIDLRVGEDGSVHLPVARHDERLELAVVVGIALGDHER